MARKWTPKSTTTYTYYPADGKPVTISLDDEGVTEELIIFLHSQDNDTHLQDRYQEENTDYAFLHKAARYDLDPEHEENPFDLIEDESSNIWKVLFSEEAEFSDRLQRLHEILPQLTDAQRDLIYRLYGERKTPTEIAREDGVSKAAIYERQKKLMNRIKKLLESDETL